MMKRLLTHFIILVFLAISIPVVLVSADSEESLVIKIDLNHRGITNEQLAEMVITGEIPHDIVSLNLHHKK